MLYCISNVLDATQIQSIQESLRAAGETWLESRVSVGYFKFNEQVDEKSAVALACQRIVVSALELSPAFISAALPAVVYPPVFNRYSKGKELGAHIDASIRLHPQGGRTLRADLSATLFLTNPNEYDGGELQIEDTYGQHNVELSAGEMVVYPATSLHQVAPITRGVRTACMFWVQSLVRDDGERALLCQMDNAIQRLSQQNVDDVTRRSLVGCYHNLVRRWSET